MGSYAPFYGGESLLQPSRRLTPTQQQFASESEACLVQGTMAVHPVAKANSWLSDTLDAAMLWLERANDAERDRFFSRAQNLSDLEQRQHHFGRTGKAHY
jgi:hypothetical protein